MEYELISRKEVTYGTRQISYSILKTEIGYRVDLTFIKDGNKVETTGTLTTTHLLQIRECKIWETMVVCFLDSLIREIKQAYVNKYGSVININRKYFEKFIQMFQTELLEIFKPKY